MIIDRLAQHPRRYYLVLLVLSLFTRLPSLAVHIIDADEAMFANAARGIMRGLVLYRDIVDQKPPVIYHLYALLLSIIDDVRFIHVATIVVVWLTAVGLYRLVSICYDNRAGIVAGILYVLFVSTIGRASNTEIFMNLPIVVGIGVFFAAPPRGPRLAQVFFAALLVGFAGLIKQQAMVVLAPMGAMLVLRNIKTMPRRLAAEAVSFIAGASLPYLAVIMHYYAAGTLGEFVRWAYLGNLSYPPPEAHMAYIVGKALLISLLTSNFILWWFALRQLTTLKYSALDPRRREALIFGGMWLVATVAAVVLGLRLYTHYFVQLTCVLVFLAAPAAAEKLKRLKDMTMVRRIALVVLIVGPAVSYFTAFALKVMEGGYVSQQSSVRKTSAFVREKTSPHEPLFTWGTPVITYLANRPNATRFVNAAFAFDNRDPCYLPEDHDASSMESSPHYAMMMDDLTRAQPAFIVDTAGSNIHCWGKFSIDKLPGLASVIRHDYEPVRNFAGIVVYRRRDGSTHRPNSLLNSTQVHGDETSSGAPREASR